MPAGCETATGRHRGGNRHVGTAGGTLALYTTVASDLFLDRATTGVGFSSTAAIAVGTLYLGRSIRSEWVAAATVLGGAIGWAVIADRDFDVATTVIWFAALVASVVGVSIERGWHAARVSAEAVGMIALLVVAGEVTTVSEPTMVGVVATLLAGALFVVPSIGDLSSLCQRVELQLAMLTAPWAFGVAVAAGMESRSDGIMASVAFAIAAVTVAMAWGLRGRSCTST